MCLIAFAIHASDRWPLVVAANRDEFFDRPSLPLTRWQNPAGQSIVSGRDVRAGGTWLGMTPSGRFAMLTNVRELPTIQPSDAASPSPSPFFAPKSRGELVMRWLENSIDANQFMAQTDSQAYAGFNLVLGDARAGHWTWLSNRTFAAGAHRPKPAGWCSRALAPGVYGLSNAALDTPWPKTLALKAALADAIKNASVTPDAPPIDRQLWTALENRQRASREGLPDTGLPLAVEEALSSVFVDSPERAYGTRCSTLLVASAAQDQAGQRHWQVQIDEKTHHQATAVHHGTTQNRHTSTVSHRLQWPASAPQSDLVF